ncbi:MAG: carboxypeptidase-like regulatory domain-containing protein, partial [Candidatus Altarchaeaceae archaeon]
MNIVRASFYLWIIVFLALILFGIYVFYVTSAPIDGKVIDYNGEPIHGAIVTISGFEEKFTTVTNKDGSFHIDNNFLSRIKDGNYHVVVKVKHGEEEYIGHESDLKIEGKPIQKTFYFKNKGAAETFKSAIDVLKTKFNEIRPSEHPSEEEEDKMKYESKQEPSKDIVDLRDLGEYSIVFDQNEEKKEVYINLMFKDKLVEKGLTIFNCSLFPGYVRPLGYHPELMNSIGLDELKNELTSADGVIKIWTKYTWPKEGQPFTDIVISPLSVYNKRIGKSKTFFDLNNGLAYAMEQAGFTPSTEEEQPS